MKWSLVALSTIGLLATLPGCHTDPECPHHPLPAGVRFEVTVTSVTRSVGCAAPTAAIGDTTVYATGTPEDNGANQECLIGTMQPPEGVNPLYGVAKNGDCRPQPSGFYCVGSLAACAGQAATVAIGVGVPALTKAGEEGEGTHQINISARESAGCPEVACLEEFTIHAKRLD